MGLSFLVFQFLEMEKEIQETNKIRKLEILVDEKNFKKKPYRVNFLANFLIFNNVKLKYIVF